MKFLVEKKNIGKNVLCMPNSVSIINRESIVIADGYKNKLLVLDRRHGTVIKSIGSIGFGKYSFKEPVGAFCIKDNLIAVADWHNHRVLFYDNFLNYLSEFGTPGLIRGNKKMNLPKRLYRIARSLAFRGSYIISHFGKKQNRKRPEISSLKCLYLSAKEFIFESRAKYSFFSRNLFMNKPNGVCFFNNVYFTTQKNACAVVLYKEEKGKYIQCGYIDKNGDENNFGRLGQISLNKDTKKLLVCDPTNFVLWRTDLYFSEWEKIDLSAYAEDGLMPFSAIEDNGYIFICGGTCTAIYNLNTFKLEYLATNTGEPHGIDLSRDTDELFVADRLNAVIKVYKIIEN